MLMAIAADVRLSNPKHVSLLPASWGTMYELTKLDDETFATKIKDGTIRSDMERRDVQEVLSRRNTESRRQLAQDLSEASAALSPTGRQFPVVYADPAWRRKAGIGNRAYENSYSTMAWDDIVAMPVAHRVLADAWLFLWIPRAHLLALHPIEIETALGRTEVKLPLAWAVAQSWGFDAYSTCFVWTKTDEDYPDDSGTGLIAWDQDELLLMFKRGRGLPKPDSDKKYGSNHRERAGRHSAKPAFYRDMINDMTGGLPVLELFAREDADHVLPPNFFTWGNQSNNTAEIACDEPFDPSTGEIAPCSAAPMTAPAERPAPCQPETIEHGARHGAVEPAPDSVSSVQDGAGSSSSSDQLEIPPFLRRTADKAAEVVS